MILLVDNYDSFVYNLRRYLERLGQEVVVARNDQLDLSDGAIEQYEAIVISPGPQSPDQAGACIELVQRYHQRVPMLGVCLGHQVMWQALGGRIIRARKPIHGRASSIRFESSHMFDGISSPFRAARYHSLVADASLPPPDLRVTAWSDDEEIMAFEHKRFPMFALQFHPESILTPCGYQLLRNFLVAAKVKNATGAMPTSDLVDAECDKVLGSVGDEEAGPIAVIPGSRWR